MCNKAAYFSKSDAVKDAKIIKLDHRRLNKKFRSSPKTGKPLHPYNCPHCDYWHLTSQKQYKTRC